MKKILYYSDCPFFAGCEQMLAVLLNSKAINDSYSVEFIYRYSKEYHDGMLKRIADSDKLYGIKLLDPLLSFNRGNRFKKIFIKVAYLILKYPIFLLNTINLYRLIKKDNYDIVHINNGGYPAAESVYSMVIACKLASIKNIIYIVNNQAADYNNLKRIYDYPLDLLVKKHVNLFITSSISAKEKLKKVLNLNNHKVTNINNGILIRKIDQTRSQTRKTLKVSNKQIIVGIVANAEIRKGIIYAIKAFELLAREYNHILLFIESDGPLKKDLINYVSVNNLNNVTFLERQNNIMNFINAIDIFLLPSISNEDFPNVILEAMSFGKAIIATNIAGIPEQIDHLENGIVISPKSSNEISDNVLKLAKDSRLRINLGNKAKIKFNKNYTSEIAVKKYMEIYNSLVKEK